MCVWHGVHTQHPPPRPLATCPLLSRCPALTPSLLSAQPARRATQGPGSGSMMWLCRPNLAATDIPAPSTSIHFRFLPPDQAHPMGASAGSDPLREWPLGPMLAMQPAPGGPTGVPLGLPPPRAAFCSIPCGAPTPGVVSLSTRLREKQGTAHHCTSRTFHHTFHWFLGGLRGIF